MSTLTAPLVRSSELWSSTKNSLRRAFASPKAQRRSGSSTAQV
ncbi:hypothetical protein [Ornithinimicrobium kibberense]